LADDSGIEVDALGGRPGVYSARYADGEAAANAKMLDELRDVAPARRTARYRAVVVVAWPDGTTLSAEGTCEGSILDAPRGGGGCGYDPIVRSSDLGRSLGEAPAEAKAGVSHRARAMRALGAVLRSRGIVG
jgi:XTP/dITP diphosphohydrolase